MGTVTMKILFVYLCCFAITAFAEPETVTIEIEHGNLSGKIEQTILSNKVYYSFKGVPYAAPPIGNLRFKAPQPLQNWTNTLKAFEYGQKCTQPDDRLMYMSLSQLDVITGGEDCLFLNVFTPELPKQESTTQLKPVLFFIHGGGLLSGSGDDFLNGPDFLIEEDVVLVTINYRLGVLGFLSLENVEIPGNFGFKDQVQALKWVQKNIEKFGGDPNSVTIFGQSAGGLSTSNLMISPLAQGLFHKVISQSGNVAVPWALNSHSVRDHAFKLGRTLGRETTDSNELIDFLRSIPAVNLTTAVTQVWKQYSDFSEAPQLPFPPCIEPKEVGDEAFLSSDPVQLLKTGLYKRVPLMIGHTNAEFMFFLTQSLLESTNLESIVRDLKIPTPLRSIRMSFESDLYKNTIKTVKDLYSLQEFSNESASNYIELMSDLWFNIGGESAARIVTEFSSEPLFMYWFSYEGTFNFVKDIKNISEPGTSHGDELCYQFVCNDYKELYKKLTPDSRDYKMIKVWSRLYSNFAKTGNPTPEADNILNNISWLPRTKDDRYFLEINEELKLKKLQENNKVDKWFDIIKNIEEQTLS